MEITVKHIYFMSKKSLKRNPFPMHTESISVSKAPFPPHRSPIVCFSANIYKYGTSAN